MALAVRPPAMGGLSRPAVDRSPVRAGGIVVATAGAGAALGLLATRDGTAGWQVARLLVVGALTAAAVVVESRIGPRDRGRLAAAIGIVVLAVAAGFTPFLAKNAASLEAAAGAVALAAGLVLAVAGTVAGTAGLPAMGRAGAAAGTVVGALLTAYVVGPAVAATNVSRPTVGATPASRGLAYESVTMTTADGVRLAGWYVPSANRAAAVLRHGAGSTRSSVLSQAAVLAHHGFGVLMVDARGHGESEGRAMDFGWYGDADIAAATRYLSGRPDVDRNRIGVVGLSMGGEEAIGATATNRLIRAVVAEGATARVAADEAWLSEEYGLRGRFSEGLEHLQDWVTDGLTSASPPTAGRAAVEASQARYLLIAAGDVAEEGHAAAHIGAGAPGRVQTWTVSGAGHTAGLRTAPGEWEARVVAFLAEALGVPTAMAR